MDINHISVSRKGCFDLCQQQYKFKYHLKVETDVEEPFYFTYGKIVHRIAEKYVDYKGKKEIGEGIVIVFASKDGKIGLAAGVTSKLTSKYDAVKFVKTGSEIVGGKGGGGRADFAQAGGVEINKIDEAFKKLKSLI